MKGGSRKVVKRERKRRGKVRAKRRERVIGDTCSIIMVGGGEIKGRGAQGFVTRAQPLTFIINLCSPHKFEYL